MSNIFKKKKSWQLLLVIAMPILAILACGSEGSPTKVGEVPSSTPYVEIQEEQTSEIIGPETPETLSTSTPIPEPTETNTPEPSSTPIQGLVKIGTHLVGKDIQPGIYWGQTGDKIFDSCYWTRMSDLTGDFGSLIANDNAIGQYYVEIKDTDFAFETACEMILLEYAPSIEFGNELPPGTYLMSRDIKPGMYQGQAGDDILDSCYWARMSDLAGDFGSLIANDNATGSFYIQVLESDFALKTNCPLVWISE